MIMDVLGESGECPKAAPVSVYLECVRQTCVSVSVCHVTP